MQVIRFRCSGSDIIPPIGVQAAATCSPKKARQPLGYVALLHLFFVDDVC